MKNVIFVLALGISLGVVGCEKSPKQTVNDANRSIDTGNSLGRQADTEYMLATTAKNRMEAQSAMNEWSLESLEKLKKMYVSSRAKFVEARSHYLKALGTAKDVPKNKAAKDSLISASYRIDVIVPKIDQYIAEIDKAIVVVKAKATGPADSGTAAAAAASAAAGGPANAIIDEAAAAAAASAPDDAASAAKE